MLQLKEPWWWGHRCLMECPKLKLMPFNALRYILAHRISSVQALISIITFGEVYSHLSHSLCPTSSGGVLAEGAVIRWGWGLMCSTRAWSTIGRWRSCDVCIQTHTHTQLPIVVYPCLDPGLTIKRAFNSGYQGLGTIHLNNQLINFKRFSSSAKQIIILFVLTLKVPLPFLINKLSINHVWSLFTGCCAVARGQERLLVALIACEQPQTFSITLMNTQNSPYAVSRGSFRKKGQKLKAAPSSVCLSLI